MKVAPGANETLASLSVKLRQQEKNLLFFRQASMYSLYATWYTSATKWQGNTMWAASTFSDDKSNQLNPSTLPSHSVGVCGAEGGFVDWHDPIASQLVQSLWAKSKPAEDRNLSLSLDSSIEMSPTGEDLSSPKMNMSHPKNEQSRALTFGRLSFWGPVCRDLLSVAILYSPNQLAESWLYNQPPPAVQRIWGSGTLSRATSWKKYQGMKTNNKLQRDVAQLLPAAKSLRIWDKPLRRHRPTAPPPKSHRPDPPTRHRPLPYRCLRLGVKKKKKWRFVCQQFQQNISTPIELFQGTTSLLAVCRLAIGRLAVGRLAVGRLAVGWLLVAIGLLIAISRLIVAIGRFRVGCWLTVAAGHRFTLHNSWSDSDLETFEVQAFLTNVMQTTQHVYQRPPGT